MLRRSPRRRSARRPAGAPPRGSTFGESGAGQDVADGRGGNGGLRATLRLDDRGDGSLGVEVRRVDVPGAEWTGVRAIVSLPLGHGLRYATELELVVPDGDGCSVAWPWGLVALSWRSPAGWEVAGALEASSTPLERYEADALVHLTYALGGATPNDPSRGTAGPYAGAR